MQRDVEMFPQMRGDRAGSLVQNLRAVNRERYNYEAFLKKFAVRGEAMKVNGAEFDYIIGRTGADVRAEDVQHSEIDGELLSEDQSAHYPVRCRGAGGRQDHDAGGV